MPLLIDCYNLLRATMPPPLAGLDEAGLCELLARAPWAQRGCTVVCDGQPKPHSPDPGAMRARGVELVHAGPGGDADSVIIRRIDVDSAPRRLKVVTDDRAIVRAARRRRAVVWSTGQCIGKLASVAARPLGTGPSPGKPGGGSLTSEQVDYWMREMGIKSNP